MIQQQRSQGTLLDVCCHSHHHNSYLVRASRKVKYVMICFKELAACYARLYFRRVSQCGVAASSAQLSQATSHAHQQAMLLTCQGSPGLLLLLPF
jgi:hypothetical protein